MFILNKTIIFIIIHPPPLIIFSISADLHPRRITIQSFSDTYKPVFSSRRNENITHLEKQNGL